MELIVLKVGDVNTTQFVLAVVDGEVGSGVGERWASHSNGVLKFSYDISAWNWFESS